MFQNIKDYADRSETLKEARENVREISIIKEITVFILLYLIILIVPMLIRNYYTSIYVNMVNKLDVVYILIDLFGVILIPIFIYIIVKKLEKRSFRSVGVSKDNVLPSVLRGAGIGFIMFLAVVIIGFLLGQYKYNGFDLSSLILLIPFLLGFFVQSFGEEIQDRGWVISFIYKRHSIIAAIIVSGLIFSISHLLNSGIDIVSLTNIFLIGLLFAVLFIKYDNIWICGSAHAAWNFSQGVLFGFTVSGDTTTPSLLKFSQISENVIGGGQFGPESSLIATFVISIGLILALYIKR